MAQEGFNERSRPLVLYAQVEAMIREEIEREGLQPGARLPTEADLCKRFGVSRSTIRQSLNRLEMEGLIKRTRGKRTFIHRIGPVVPDSTDTNTKQFNPPPATRQKILGIV